MNAANRPSSRDKNQHVYLADGLERGQQTAHLGCQDRLLPGVSGLFWGIVHGLSTRENQTEKKLLRHDDVQNDGSPP